MPIASTQMQRPARRRRRPTTGRARTGSRRATRTAACTPIVTVLDSVRPRISDSRRAGVTRWRSIDALAQLLDDPEAGEAGTEDRELHQQPGDEDPPRVVAAEPAAGDVLAAAGRTGRGR